MKGIISLVSAALFAATALAAPSNVTSVEQTRTSSLSFNPVDIELKPLVHDTAQNKERGLLPFFGS
jgi:hypothetical protein